MNRAGAVSIAVAALALGLSVAPLRGNPPPAAALTAVALAVAAIAATAMSGGGAAPIVRALSLALTAPLLLTVTGRGTAGPTRTLDILIGPLVVALTGASLLRGRATIAAAIVGGAVAGPFAALFYDPFLDATCAGCGHGALAVWPNTAAVNGLRIAGLGVIAVAGLVGARRRGGAVVVVATGFAVGHLVAAHRDAVLVAGAAAVALVWLWRGAAAWHRHVAITRLLAVHAGTTGLTETLRHVTGDPTLSVTFPADGTFVDADGLPLAAGADQVLTDLVLGGELVARVHHGRASRLPQFDAALDPISALILHKERLTAQLAARVHDVTRERSELVRVGLAERRALERDLHDGVQQELLALGLGIRLALGSLPPDSPDRLALDSAMEAVHEAVDQVRAISQGVSPPLLTARGLGPAVAALVRRRGAAVEVGSFPAERLPADVERAAYAVVAEALARGASSLTATMDGTALHVIADGARPGVEGILPDLIAAIGGTLAFTGSRAEATLPRQDGWVPSVDRVGGG